MKNMNKVSTIIVVIFILFLGIYANGQKVKEDDFIIKDNETETLEENEPNFSNSVEKTDFNLETLEGGNIELKSLRGKPTVVNFFASWCPPCRNEIPDFNEIYEKYSENINFLGINLQEDNETVKNMVAELNIKYTVALDKTGEIANNYSVNAIPTTVFFNSKGEIEIIYPGMMTKVKLEEIIKDLK